MFIKCRFRERGVFALTLVVFCIASIGASSAASLLFGLRARSDSELYSISSVSGQGALVGETGIFVGDGLAPSANGSELWATREDELYIVSTSDGSSGFATDFSIAFSADGLAYDAGRNLLYASDYGSGNFYSILPETGAATLLGSGATLHGLAFAPGRDTLFGIDRDTLYSINLATGTPTSVGSLGVVLSTGGSGLAYDMASDTLYAASRNQADLFAVNPDTGLATSIGMIGIGEIHGLAVIPEPGVIPFLASGLSLLLIRSRKVSAAR